MIVYEILWYTFILRENVLLFPLYSHLYYAVFFTLDSTNASCLPLLLK